MILAGLDIATVTGVALMKDGKITTQTFRADGKKRFLERDDDKSIDAVRMGMAFRSFEDFLTAFLLNNSVDAVAIEAPLNTNFQRKKLVTNADAIFAGQSKNWENVGGASLATFFKIHGLEAVALAVCTRWNIPAEFVNQGTWRKEFLGNGRPKDPKKEARLMCIRLGIECTSDDAAESAGVVTWLNNKLNPYGIRRANDLFKAATT